MASTNKNESASRPSWSKIAASGYIPPNAKPKVPNAQQAPSDVPTTAKSPHPNPRAQSSSLKAPEARTQLEKHVVGPVSEGSNQSGKPTSIRKMESSSKPVLNDDGSTQLSSDDSAKPLSFDTKSVTSAATFALDEKESLRPDDSASMRAAIEEEDMFSAPGSVITGSRVGSDFGGKQLREQLQEVPYITTAQARGAGGTLYEPSAPMPPTSGLVPVSQAPTDALRASSDTMQDLDVVSIVTPDEKLMDALQSQRDRVWVLKLEQDIIDFVSQSKMLAHKLADYYRLDHAVAQTGTGAAVVISKTMFVKTPPPLSGIAIVSNVADTPPLIATARKIMRRTGDNRSENTTAANSEGPSASVSEVGIDGSAVNLQTSSKSKAQRNREEREKQYAEARERIFGKADLADRTDAASTPDEAEQSRSSSVTDKRKNIRRQRNLSDDDFEPRSQFPAYYTHANPSTLPSMHADQQFYQPYGGINQGQMYMSHHPTSPGAFYGPPQHFSPTTPDGQGGVWPAQASHNVYSNSFNQGLPPGYDISAHMQSAMHFQSGQINGAVSMRTDAMSPVNQFASPVMPTSPQANMSSWQPQPTNFANGYYSQSNMNANFTIEQAPSFQSYGTYGTQATGDYQQFHRPQFNPQTQAFVPSGPQAYYGGTSMMAGQFPQLGTLHPPAPDQRFSQSSGQSSAMPVNFASSPRRSPRATESSSPYYGAPPSSQTQTRSPAQDHKGRKQASGTITGASSKDPGLEITAKFGTPSSLPARPPPPQSMEPHKFHEINRGAGGLQAYPGMPRLASNGLPGSHNGSTAAGNTTPNTGNNAPPQSSTS